MLKKLFLNGKFVCEYDSTADDQADAELCRRLLKDRGLWREITTEQTCYNQAVAFGATAARLWRDDLSGTPVRNGHSAGPFVVNAAFSTKLYLKALALLHGKSLRGHDLDKLLRNLPAPALSDLENRLITLLPEAPLWDSTIRSFDDFRSVIRAHKDAFEHYRYLYEGTRQARTFHFKDGIFAMKVLHETCSKHPTIASG